MEILWGIFTLVFWLVIVVGITAFISFISRSKTKKNLLARIESQENKKYIESYSEEDRKYAESYPLMDKETLITTAIITAIVVIFIGSLLGSTLPKAGETPLTIKGVKKSHILYNMSNKDLPYYVQYNAMSDKFVYLTDSSETNKKEYENTSKITKFVFDSSITEPICEVRYAEYKYFWQYLFMIDAPGMFGYNTVNVIHLPSEQNIRYMALMEDNN